MQTSDLTPWESHRNLEEKFEKYGQEMMGGGINTGCDTFLRRETRKELSTEEDSCPSQKEKDICLCV